MRRKIFFEIILLTSFFFFILFTNGQEIVCPKSVNKKAIQFFQDASTAFKSRKYDEAKKNVAKAIDEDPEFADAYLLQGNLALKGKDEKELEQNYKKVIELCPSLDPEVYFQLGWLYFDLKKWKDAEDYLKKFLDFDRID